MRRLMTTADFTEFKTTVLVDSPKAGSRPIFDNPMKSYTSTGLEKKQPEVEAAQKQESTFLGKYWMYILMAFLVLPRLLPDDAPSQGGGGGAPAR